MTIRIVKGGKPIELADAVGPQNAVLQSLIKQLDISSGGKTITLFNYNYKAFLDMLLNFSSNEKYSAEVYSLDRAKKFDTLTMPATGGFAETDNTGYCKRAARFKNGEVELTSNVLFDLSQQKRYLINGVGLHFKFWLASDNFMLLSATSDYSIEIVNATLQLHMVRVANKIMVAHAAAITEKPCQYPFTRSVVRTVNISRGSYDEILYPIFQREVPSEIIVGFVTSKAYNGDFQSNAYNFQNFGLNYICVTVDDRVVPHAAFTPNYGKKLYSECYRSFFSEGQISESEYPNGYCLYRFKLYPTHTDDCLAVEKTGEVKVYVRFDEALKEGVTAIVYGKIPDLIQIDESRNLIL